MLLLIVSSWLIRPLTNFVILLYSWSPILLPTLSSVFHNALRLLSSKDFIILFWPAIASTKFCISFSNLLTSLLTTFLPLDNQ